MNTVRIYTDGSCNRKTKDGGIGVYFTYLDSYGDLIAEKEISEGRRKTTIGKCELEAMCAAVDAIIPLRQGIKYEIVCDSKYITDSINERWFEKWDRYGREDIKHINIWKAFNLKFFKHDLCRIKFIHTKGHGKGHKQYIEGNNRADKLANYKNFIEHGIYDEECSESDISLLYT
jgi:ribonuclease HI